MGSAAAHWAPANARQGQELRFRDFFSPCTGNDGNQTPQISDRLRQAEGKKVRLVGFMRLRVGRHIDAQGYCALATLQLQPHAALHASADALAGYLHSTPKRRSTQSLTSGSAAAFWRA
ncbi:MAG: hypothetical protein H7293_01185 [Candidatus Saccharibacteria bacterium]|nr:hypothetical protein [Rhodoferax sp.]